MVYADVANGNAARNASVADVAVCQGQTVEVWCGCYLHMGIADGRGGVIHASKQIGKVVHTSLEEFANGGNVLVNLDITSDGLSGAYQHALARLGECYDFINGNCEHFVREMHGLKKECRQLQKATIGGTALVVASQNVHPALKYASMGAALGTAISKNPAEGAFWGGLAGLFISAISK